MSKKLAAKARLVQLPAALLGKAAGGAGGGGAGEVAAVDGAQGTLAAGAPAAPGPALATGDLRPAASRNTAAPGVLPSGLHAAAPAQQQPQPHWPAGPQTTASAGALSATPLGASALPPAAAATVATATEPRPRTAPGSMALFMASQSAALKEADALRAQLKAFDGSTPVRALDPLLVRPSRWANRHEQSFADAAFSELKADIASAGTNVQPVCVRPLPGVLNGSTPEGAPAYELVFGHRRHRACLELGLPVQAMVTELNDRALFEAMERENRARKNLSAFEQGTMYKRALDEGLYPSQRRLSEALGVDVSLVSKSLSLARLPEAVVAAFASPLDIQFRWAQPLADALQKDPEGVLARAARLRAAGPQGLSAAQVLAALLTPMASAGAHASPADDHSGDERQAPRVIAGKAGRRAVLSRDARGQLTVAFSPGALSQAAEAELAQFIEKVLGKR